jgi:hypothetical protein
MIGDDSPLARIEKPVFFSRPITIRSTALLKSVVDTAPGCVLDSRG